MNKFTASKSASGQHLDQLWLMVEHNAFFNGRAVRQLVLGSSRYPQPIENLSDLILVRFAGGSGEPRLITLKR